MLIKLIVQLIFLANFFEFIHKLLSKFVEYHRFEVFNTIVYN